MEKTKKQTKFKKPHFLHSDNTKKSKSLGSIPNLTLAWGINVKKPENIFIHPLIDKAWKSFIV